MRLTDCKPTPVQKAKKKKDKKSMLPARIELAIFAFLAY